MWLGGANWGRRKHWHLLSAGSIRWVDTRVVYFSVIYISVTVSASNCSLTLLFLPQPQEWLSSRLSLLLLVSRFGRQRVLPLEVFRIVSHPFHSTLKLQLTSFSRDPNLRICSLWPQNPLTPPKNVWASRRLMSLLAQWDLFIKALIVATRNMLNLFNFYPSPVLSEWSDGSVYVELSNQQAAAPAHQYVCASVLQGWCKQAQWMEEALLELRSCLGPQLQRVSLEVRGRALGGSHARVDAHTKRMREYSVSCKEPVHIFIGQFLWGKVCLEDLSVSKDLSMALTEGLTALTREEEVRKTVKMFF